MHPPRLTSRLSGGLALAALASGLFLSAGAAQAQQVPGSPAPSPAAVAVPQHAEPPGVRAMQHPLMLAVRGHDAKGRPLVATGAPGGYTAAQVRASAGLRGTGEGQTVAIVDAFDDPYAEQDLDAYSAQMGLPPICKGKHTKNCFTFERLHPDGIGGLDRGWSVETSLDIEMVHAMAPQAKIVLVEALDPTYDRMFSALDYAASLHPAAISNSWGDSAPEDPAELALDQHCQLTDGVCVFSTGDLGLPGEYPSYNPHVLAVGGTKLGLDRAGTVLSETTWEDTGGGVSQYEPRPAYQPETLNPNPGRGIPDVSFDADPNTGVAVYSTAGTGWLKVGGTSVGAPAWAGILAAADQLRATAGKPVLTAAGDEVQNAVYQLTTGLADITEGSSVDRTNLGGCGAICDAGPGYDFVTGLGSPRAGIDTGLASAP